MNKNHGRTLLVTTAVLVLLGLLAVADSSAPQALAYFKDSLYFVKSQMIWIVLGILLLFVGLIVDYKYWEKIAGVIFVVNIILLIAVLIPGIGTKVLGARRWISIGGITLQPSELIKISLILFMAKLTNKERPFWHLILPIAAVAGLVMLEPDLGTTIAIIVIGFTQLFVAGVSLLPFLATIFGGGILGFIFTIISSYRRERLSSFLELISNPLGTTNYHVRQILISLGSGGLFGVGLGQGKQKYLFLPESATDSVFANIAEELGFVGSLVVILILLFFIYQMIKITINAPDKFASLVGTGIVAWICAQIFLNIASMVALIPLTGVPLPFFSYGGSNLTVILFAVGVLLNISKHVHKEERFSK